MKVPLIANVGCIVSNKERPENVWRSERMSDALLDIFWPFLEPSLERDRTPKIVTINVVFPLLSALVLISDALLLL